MWWRFDAKPLLQSKKNLQILLGLVAVEALVVGMPRQPSIDCTRLAER